MSSLCPCFFQSAQNWLSTRSPTAIDRWLGFTLVALASLASREISIHSSTFIYTYIYVWFYILFHHVSSIYHLSMIFQRSLISLISKTLDDNNNNNLLWSSTTFSWFIRTTCSPCGDSLQTSRNSPWTRRWQPGNFAMSCAPSALAALWPGQPEEK